MIAGQAEKRSWHWRGKHLPLPLLHLLLLEGPTMCSDGKSQPWRGQVKQHSLGHRSLSHSVIGIYRRANFAGWIGARTAVVTSLPPRKAITQLARRSLTISRSPIASTGGHQLHGYNGKETLKF